MQDAKRQNAVQSKPKASRRQGVDIIVPDNRGGRSGFLPKDIKTRGGRRFIG